MHAKPSLTVVGALIAAGLAASVQAAPAGHIPNPLTDKLIVDPLKKADTIWDVFDVMNGWLSEVYPKKGPAREAIDAFDGFIDKFNDELAKDPKHAPRTVEMPMGVDRYLKLLRKEAPGVGGNAWMSQAETNVKAQLYTAALLPFLQLRGIAYRVRPLVEHSYILHTAAVNNLRHMKQDLRVRAGNNGLAVFEFLTYPLPQTDRDRVQFFKVSELQQWVLENLIPTLDVSIEIATGALKSMGGDSRESLDLAVFMKADNPFPDETMEMGNRYFSVPEVEAMLGRMYRHRAQLRLFCAYDLDDLPEVTNKLRDVLTRAFFKEKVSFGKKPRIGSPPVVRYRVVEKFGKFATLKDPSQGPAALRDFRRAWSHHKSAMDGFFAAQAGGPDRVVDLDWIHASQKDFKSKVSPQVSAVLAGPASITDYVGGATVDIDVPGILNNLPQDLKGFFPGAYVEENPYWSFAFKSGDLAYTNYDFGTPVGWKAEAASDTWGKLFPNISKDKNAEGHWDAPLWVYRDVSRTYLGGLIGPLMAVMIY